MTKLVAALFVLAMLVAAAPALAQTPHPGCVHPGQPAWVNGMAVCVQPQPVVVHQPAIVVVQPQPVVIYQPVPVYQPVYVQPPVLLAPVYPGWYHHPYPAYGVGVNLNLNFDLGGGRRHGRRHWR